MYYHSMIQVLLERVPTRTNRKTISTVILALAVLLVIILEIRT